MAFLAVAVLVTTATVSAGDERGSDDGYKIGPDDVISVQVWQRKDLSGSFTVDDQGNLNLPLLGPVSVEGMTAEALGDELERRFAILDPGVNQVLVTVTQFLSRRFTVVGEVHAPGIFTFREFPTLWDVILRAGGATPEADMSGVQIVREGKDDGPSETLTVDLSAGIEGTDPSTLPPLQRGDSIVVPALELNAVSGKKIQVLGSVRTPGIYPLKAAGTVVEAVSVSGGHLDSADLSSVRLARRTGDGTIVYRLDLKHYLEDGYPNADLPLRPGDTVTVPSRRAGAGGVLRTVLQFSGLLSAVAGIIIASNQLR